MASIIVSMYWNNIEPKIVSCQKEVFKSFGYDIEQVAADGIDHGQFIDSMMQSLAKIDCILLLDIDCFPMNGDVVEEAFRVAKAGGIYGCAQTANHIDPVKIYAGPMFVCLSKKTWDMIGRPSAKFTKAADVGQSFTECALAQDLQVKLLYPTISILPRWQMGNNHLFGIGTFYEGKVFHLFESRGSYYGYILEEVAASICAQRDIDYFALMRRAQLTSHFEKIFKAAKRLGFWF